MSTAERPQAGPQPTSAAVLLLRSPETIRSRCHGVLQAAAQDRLAHFALDLSRLAHAARITAEVTRARYPSLQVPIHSRMAHFDAGGVPRTATLRAKLTTRPALERARALLELVMTSVLLDAGSGMAWRYRDGAHDPIGRSEGLAIASLAWIERGGLSSRGVPYEVDAAGLLAVDGPALCRAFQVSADNPLLGVAGRAQLLQGLGQVLQQRPDVFGPGENNARLGGLVDHCLQLAQGGALGADRLLALLLDVLGNIWPGRLHLDGVPLGDVWPHPAAGGSGPSAGLIPFHKLTQWLTLSLVEPLAEAGLQVRDLPALTGLSEYRNGGLFIDSGVLRPKHEAVLGQAHPAHSEVVVEWRALTVALLDRIVAPVNEALSEASRDPVQLTLPAVLEGGTWAAGRRLAQELRADGGPPLQVISDGTVF